MRLTGMARAIIDVFGVLQSIASAINNLFYHYNKSIFFLFYKTTDRVCLLLNYPEKEIFFVYIPTGRLVETPFWNYYFFNIRLCHKSISDARFISFLIVYKSYVITPSKYSGLFHITKSNMKFQFFSKATQNGSRQSFHFCTSSLVFLEEYTACQHLRFTTR